MGEKPEVRLSWSRLRTHGECPAKGDLLARGKKSPVTDARNFFPGTVVDRCQRQWLSQEHPEPGWMAQNVDAVLDAEEKTARETGDGVVKWKSASDKREVRELCQRAVHQLEADLGVTCLPYEWDPAVRFEVPLTIPYREQKVKIALIGEMDLFTRRPDGLVVWDTKVTRDDSYWRKTIGQLVFYEIAVWGMTGEWPHHSGLLQPLCKETMPWWAFTQEHRVQMFTRIAAVAADILDKKLPPKAGSQCKWCPVRHACPLKGGGRGRVPFGGVTGA